MNIQLFIVIGLLLASFVNFYAYESVFNVSKKNKLLVPASIINKNTSSETINFTPYMSQVYNKIKDNWNPPKLSNSKKVVIYMVVNRDGSLSVSKIVKSSGNKLLDDSVIDAVKKSEPFDIFPKCYLDDSIKIVYEFVYEQQSKK